MVDFSHIIKLPIEQQGTVSLNGYVDIKMNCSPKLIEFYMKIQ